MSCTDSFGIEATIVANEFIEKYMPDANGDYVKVYLYLLKNRSAGVEISAIAEVLHLTEGDVRRAIKYWEEKGIVSVGRKASAEADIKENKEKVSETALETKAKLSEAEALKENYKNAEGRSIINSLKEDEDFAQLLFIVQKYLARLLKERDLEVLAYLYHGLKLPCEVIDYLVEYCAENKHTSIRYIEKVGINWAEIGIGDVKSAKRHTAGFDKAVEASKEKTARKRTVRADRQGIMRDYDIDEIIKKRVLEKI